MGVELVQLVFDAVLEQVVEQDELPAEFVRDEGLSERMAGGGGFVGVAVSGTGSLDESEGVECLQSALESGAVRLVAEQLLQVCLEGSERSGLVQGKFPEPEQVVKGAVEREVAALFTTWERDAVLPTGLSEVLVELLTELLRGQPVRGAEEVREPLRGSDRDAVPAGRKVVGDSGIGEHGRAMRVVFLRAS